VKVAFDFPSGATPPIPGLDKGKVELRARIDGVNGVKANVATPARSKPLSELPDTGVAGLVKCVMEAVAKGDSLASCAAQLVG